MEVSGLHRVWRALGTCAAVLIAATSLHAQMATLRVSTSSSATVPGDYVGFSWEWGAIQKVLGQASTGVDPIARQLIANLTATGAPVLIRVGGNSSDTSTAPQNVEPLVELASAVNVRYSLGINLRTADLEQQKAQEQAYVQKIPPGKLISLEIGNEPNGYAGTFSPEAYQAKAANSLGRMHAMNSTVAFSGPSCSAYINQRFLCDGPTFHKGFDVVSFLKRAQAQGLKIATAHYYYMAAGKCAPDCLLQPPAYGSASMMSPYVRSAHQLGMKFQINEFNSLSGGGQAGVSDTFSSALWFIGNAMALAAAGVDGIDVHGSNITGGSRYDPFFISVKSGTPNQFSLSRVAPIYYGMLFVRIATQNNDELHTVSVVRAKPCSVSGWDGCLQAWQSVDTNGVERLTVLNLDEKNAGSVNIANSNRTASVCYLSAPSFESASGVTFAGQTFDGSATGKISGNPNYTVLRAHGGIFTIPIHATQAAIVRFGASGGC